MNKNNKTIFVLILIMALWKNTCFARYIEILDVGKYYATIAEPIFVVRPLQETNVFKANENNSKVFTFEIKNYEEREDNIRISEVDLKYFIEIRLSNNSIPITLKLYDCTTNEEIVLDSLNRTEEYTINKNSLFERQFKLVVSLNGNKELKENLDIEIYVNSTQKNERGI